MQKEKSVLKNGMRQLFVTLICCSPLSSALAQLRPPVSEPTETEAVYTLEFTENFGDAAPRPVTPLPAKAQRVSSHAGNVSFNFDAAVPDSVRIAANVAANIWGAMLMPLDSVKIDFGYQPLTNDVETEVRYQEIGGQSYCPKSYYVSRINTNVPHNMKIAGSIKLNSSQSWECGFGDVNNISARNVTYAVMRSIANILGFGSSLCVKNKHISFALEKGYSTFDYMVFNSNDEFLSEIPHLNRRDNPRLNAFVQPTAPVEIFVAKQHPQYKLYAPPVYESGKSLVYLDNPGSLMHHDLNVGDKSFTVDAVTRELLDSVGWGLGVQPAVKISSDDVDSTGIASAYESHRFTVNHQGQFNNSHWSYSLMLKDGTAAMIKEQTGGDSFEVPALSDISRFGRNVNGDLCGKIKLTGELDGVAVEDVFNLYLEVEPVITKVEIIDKVLSADGLYYDLLFNVTYLGSETVKYEVEQDMIISYIDRYSVNEPFIAHCKVPHLVADLTTWVDITVKNAYGSDKYTIELPPFGQTTSDISPAGIVGVATSAPNPGIEVYSVSGVRLGYFDSPNCLNELPVGIYLIKCSTENGLVKTIKYIKR